MIPFYRVKSFFKIEKDSYTFLHFVWIFQSTFRREIGLKFSKIVLSLYFFGISVMIPLLWVIESFPDWKAWLRLSVKVLPISCQKKR